MKKKYLISFILIVAVLIASVITFGIISNVQMKKLEKAKYYKIGEVEIQTINYATDTKLKLENYSYGSNGDEHKKFFEYSVKNAEGVSGLWTEYLISDENFVIETEETYMRVLTKEYENKDVLKIVLSFKDDVVEINLIYLYKD